jgi:acetyl-CoA carboxylase carboxyl transferase subunit alpha
VLTKVLRLFAGGPCADPGTGRQKKQTTKVSRPTELLAGEAPVASTLDPWSAVQLARNTNRPFALDYIGMVFSEFLELRGDREFADDPAIVAGLASLEGRTVAVVGHQKGRTTQDRLERRFGMARPEGYRKALRVMHAAEKFGFPVVTFIDTPGADPSLEAEERGQAWAIAQNLAEMVELRVPTVALVIGEGGSGGALAIGVADRLLMLENATYSVVSPEGCASILWNDAALAPQAAAAMRLTAWDLKQAGIADAVVPEPEGGAHEDYAQAGGAVRQALTQALAGLESEFGAGARLDHERLLQARFEKYRRVGVLRDRPEPEP